MIEPNDSTFDDRLRNALESPGNPDFEAWRERHGDVLLHLNLVSAKTIRRKAMLWRIANVSLAAVFLIVGFYGLMTFQRESYAQGFHHFSQVLSAAKSVRYWSQTTTDGKTEDGARWYFLAPGRRRAEWPNLTSIVDPTVGKSVLLNVTKKTALVMSFEAGRDDQEPDHFERLRVLLADSEDAKEKDFQRLGERVIDGRKAVGFRLEHPAATITLWGDPKTGTPIRIETEWNGSPRTVVVMTQFEINVELAESLFDVTPPPDYTIQSVDFEATKRRELDLLAAFEFASDHCDGDFPATMDLVGLESVVVKYVVPRMKDQEADSGAIEKLLKEVVPLYRGFQFALGDLPDSADAHYAGIGIKRGETDRPIFWYKPDGLKPYRVIYADLTVKVSDTAPQVSGAKPLKAPGQSSGRSD